MNKRIFFLIFISFFFQCRQNKNANYSSGMEIRVLSVQEYQEAVYASWLGQIIGNTYGLGYEFKYIDQAGPDSFPYGYSKHILDDLYRYNGAFSDDDTDIEYMYLTVMEKHGIEPDYSQLAAAWKAHVKKRVWCANRAALTLMHAGHYPPVTGSKKLNTQWSQIDPQLVNEIWAVTAPGMIQYSVDKTEFTARITNDSFGIEPALHYAAMYSAAFFEKNIMNLIEIGTAALPPGSRFCQIVEHVKHVYHQYPENWQTARKIIKDRYLVQADYNKFAWAPIDANLNGAFGILALLYGHGDFQKTLDYACAFGMDADNQAATMCGLLGIIHGLDGIPENLLFPLQSKNWEKPFNDFYKMITREGLTDASISEMADRIAAQGENIILAKGGKKISNGNKEYYEIQVTAQFIPPFELNPFPILSGEISKPFSYPVYTGKKEEDVILKTRGKLPPGISISDGQISGVASESRKYHFKLIAQYKDQTKVQPVTINIHSTNLAPSADKILFNTNGPKNIGLIRDGSIEETYYSIKPGNSREIDHYGYLWDQPVTISALTFNNGIPTEFCGWFTTFSVEYLTNNKWEKIDDLNIYPEMNLENSQWLKPHFINYNITFPTIKTKGIRITGLGGGIPKDAANAHLGTQYYTGISELSVYEY